jgi:hypothetical protein
MKLSLWVATLLMAFSACSISGAFTLIRALACRARQYVRTGGFLSHPSALFSLLAQFCNLFMQPSAPSFRGV